MIPISIRITFSIPPDFSKRGFKEVQRQANAEAVLEWFHKFLKGHFDAGASAKYAYQARKWKFSKKNPKSRYQPALVHTGLTRDTALRGTPLVRAFPTRARLDIPTPPYVKMVPGKGGRPNLGAEMVALAYSELGYLEQFLVKAIERGIERVKQSGSRTVVNIS